MGYRHISNLYRNKDILHFKQAYALEKVHGTSAHVRYRVGEDKLLFFSGGAKHETFLELFDENKLLEMFKENASNHPDSKDITLYGEAYGGKLQGMSDTYGKELKFIVFEVKINDEWLGVERAEIIATKFGQEFVPYKIINTTEEEINAAMNEPSEVAVRRGCGNDCMREGIVLRPLIEVMFANGGRIICKHKRPEFAERRNTPSFADPEKLKQLEDAKAIATEWVVHERLRHVLDALALYEPRIEDMNKVIKGMVEDIMREGEGEVVDNKDVRKAIGKQTSKIFREHLSNLTFAR